MACHRGEDKLFFRLLITIISSSGVYFTASAFAQVPSGAQANDKFWPVRNHQKLADAKSMALDGKPLNFDIPLEKASPPGVKSRSLINSDVKVLFEQGYQARQQGHYKEAIEKLEKASALSPDNPDILRELGLSFMGLGELDKAEPIFRQLLEMVPDDIEAKTGLVKIDYAHNNLEEAKYYTEEILALKPDNEEVKSLQTEILNAIVFQKKLEHTTRASSVIRSPSINDLKSINLHFGKKDYDKVEKNAGSDNLPDTISENRTSNYFLELSAAIRSNVPDRSVAGDLAKRGFIFLTMGKVEEAQADFEKALRLTPTLSLAQLGKAAILYWQGDFFAAKEMVDHVIAIEPENSIARDFKFRIDAAIKFSQTEDKIKNGNLSGEPLSDVSDNEQKTVGQLYEIGSNERKAQHFDLAKQHFEAALALEPDNADILVQLGLTLLALGDLDAAKENFSRALMIAPDYIDANLGLARIAYWKGELDKAKALCEMALSQSPDNEELTSLLKDIERAIASKNKIAKHGGTGNSSNGTGKDNPQLVESNHLAQQAAQIVASGKNFAHAEALYRQALSLTPQNVDLLIKLGNVLSFQKKFAEADKIFDQALEISPDALEASLGKVNVALWQNDYALARHRIDALLLRYPENEEVALSDASLYMAEHQYKRAITVYNRILEKNSKNLQAWLGRGDAKRGLLRDREAVNDYDQARIIAPDNRETLERIQRPIRKRWRLDIDSTYSELTAPYKNWREGGVALSYQLSEATILTGRLGLSNRFNMDDQQFELAIAHQFRPAVWGYLAGVVTPDADFLARYILRAGGSSNIGRLGKVGMLGATLDTKSEWYDNGVVKTITPGLRQTFFKDRMTIFAQWINVFDQKNKHSGGYLLRAETNPVDRFHFNIGYSSTLESSGDVLIPTKTIFGNIAFDITEDLTIGANLSKEQRTNAYNRLVYGLNLTRRF